MITKIPKHVPNSGFGISIIGTKALTASREWMALPHPSHGMPIVRLSPLNRHLFSDTSNSWQIEVEMLHISLWHCQCVGDATQNFCSVCKAFSLFFKSNQLNMRTFFSNKAKKIPLEITKSWPGFGSKYSQILVKSTIKRL